MVRHYGIQHRPKAPEGSRSNEGENTYNGVIWDEKRGVNMRSDDLDTKELTASSEGIFVHDMMDYEG